MLNHSLRAAHRRSQRCGALSVLSAAAAAVLCCFVSIRQVYFDQCDEDLQKSIAVLVAATGLHEELIVETRPEDSSAEEKKDGDQKTPAQPQPAFVSSSSLLPLPAKACCRRAPR
jgi:hypothetical protein